MICGHYQPRSLTHLLLGNKQEPTFTKFMIKLQHRIEISCFNGFSLISESRTRTIVAFDPDQWSRWFKDDPNLTNMERRPQGQLVPNSQKFLETGGDVFFLIKSDVQNEVKEVYSYLEKRMTKFCRQLDMTESSPPNKVTSSFLF